jgi:hypothetical protein
LVRHLQQHQALSDETRRQEASIFYSGVLIGRDEPRPRRWGLRGG